MTFSCMYRALFTLLPPNITHWTCSISSPVLLFLCLLCVLCVYAHTVKPWLGTGRKAVSVILLLFLQSPAPSVLLRLSVCERGCVIYIQVVRVREDVHLLPSWVWWLSLMRSCYSIPILIFNLDRMLG